MARLKNVSGNALSLFAQPGEANAYHVEPDGIVTVPGECTNADDKDADAYIIGEGPEARLWSKTSWKLTKPGDSTDSDAPETSSTARTGGRRTSGGSAENAEG